MKKHHTIKTIAAEAGVSVATVSRVINSKDPEKVGAKVREKVKKLINKYKFTPNSMAKNLICGKSNFIGLQLLSTDYSMELLNGIEKKASAGGYNIILGISDWNMEKEEQSINAMLEKGVDGILWIPSRSKKKEFNKKILKKILASKCPLLFLNKEVEIAGPTVCGDNEFGAYMAAKHIWLNGFQNIAFIGPSKDNHSEKRFAGYRKLMFEKNATPVFLESSHKESISAHVALDFLARNKSVNAFLCASDYIALGVYDALMHKGIKIGKDIAVTGYDNLAFSRYLHPPLTTVSPCDYKIGETASELLMKLIAGDKIPEKVFIKPELTVRNSCGKNKA